MKKLIILISAFFIAFSLPAVPLRDILPSVSDEDYSKLLSGEIIKQNTSEGDLSLTAPSSELVTEKIEYILSMEKGFGVSAASLVPYPEEWKTMTKSGRRLALYNSLLKISTLQGLTYISHRAGDKEKVLFNECSMLSSDNEKDRIGDPEVEKVPMYAEYYSYQDDTSFGGNVYWMAYSAFGDEIFLDIKNNNDLKFLGISLVKKDKVNMSLDFIEVDEGIYVYALASVKDKKPKVNVLFYTVDLELSFYNRIVALSSWFRNNISQS